MKDEQPILSYREKLALIRSGQMEKTTKAKPKKPIAKVSKKRLAEDKAAKETGKPASKLELDKWFDDIRKKHWITNVYPCMECGEMIPISFSRHATAHLLPKKLFKSVATHELNYLILGAGCGCHEKSHRIDKFVQLRCWPEAARRIKIMMPLFKTDELRSISNQLLIALDNTP